MDKKNIVNHPCVSFKGLQKSAIVLYDIMSYYLPLHGLSCRDFYTCYPVIGFVEALIYQVAEEVETGRLKKTLWHADWLEKKHDILDILHENNIDHPKVSLYLDEIEAYLAAIVKLKHSGPTQHADIMHVAGLRPADFFLLYTIMHCMLNLTWDDRLFSLLRTDNIWGDLRGSIQEYEDDKVIGRYNTYQMFVILHGEKAPQHFQAELARYKKRYAEQLAELPEKEQLIHLEINTRYYQDYPSVPIPKPDY